jgi:hypothetical protein
VVDGVDGVVDFHCDGCVPVVEIKDFFSNDLVDTVVIGVDNFLKCVQDELQKVVYIFGPVADVKDGCYLQVNFEEEGGFLKLEGPSILLSK